ncbi:MAG TPA: LPS export ABC transporter ATP-binding protein [Coxiellaceae bacterium]|nr:LPS export ABC transporter ATP-binding protein [Coxiellaceae bacterium]
MTMLSAQHLEKTFKTRKVVDDISIEIKANEIVGLLGPNGAGKTTCFYMVVGLITADKGAVYLNEQNISTLPMHQRARLGIGYLPQEPSIFRKLTVSENILAILEQNSRIEKSERSLKLTSLMDELHVSHLANIQGIRLSGGERRRVEIARALAMDPQFMLLDEPFAGIDPISIIDIKKIIKHLKARGIGILITDHNVRETLDICERAYIVSEGRIIAEGEPSHILKNRMVRKVYLGDEFEL